MSQALECVGDASGDAELRIGKGPIEIEEHVHSPLIARTPTVA
jgi:hypothetical protein